MNIKWNAQDYTRDFAFVHRYGEDVLRLLGGKEGDSVIDLGCGNGALTARIAETGAKVVGIDSSTEMLAVAKEKHPTLEFRQADALNFTVEEPIDAVFSNAVFHWIDEVDQPRLLRQIHDALKAQGLLVCEFGGKNCAASVHDALRRAFARRGMDYVFRFYFPTIGEYATLLEQAGFRVELAMLFDRATPCENGERGLRQWIEMFVKLPFEGVAPDTKGEIIAEVERELRATPLHATDGWRIDYVRIRLRAVRI